MRTSQIERRKRTRHLIELGGLVVKAGIVDLTNDDRAMIFGAMIWMAEKLKSEGGDYARYMDETRKDSVRDGASGRPERQSAAAAESGVTDGGRRGDLTYRSAARHRATCRANTNLFALNVLRKSGYFALNSVIICHTIQS